MKLNKKEQKDEIILSGPRKFKILTQLKLAKKL